MPVVLGSDKTTVSIATGQSEYYPLYLSIGNIRNNVRRAHRNGVALIAFLPIPKSKSLMLFILGSHLIFAQLIHTVQSHGNIVDVTRRWKTPMLHVAAGWAELGLGHIYMISRYLLEYYVYSQLRQVLIIITAHTWAQSTVSLVCMTMLSQEQAQLTLICSAKHMK